MQSALSPVMYLEASLQVLFVLSRRSALQGNWKGKVRLELAVMLHEQTPEIVDFLAQLPDWTTSVGFTVYQKVFTF